MLVSKAQMGALERAAADGGGRSLWKDARIRFFRNRAAAAALVVLILISIFAFFGGAIAQYDGETIDWARMGDIAGLGAPSIENGHYFGLDEMGRDLFARTVQGTRISLMVGVVGALIAVVVGTLYGAIAGYFGGRIDGIMMRTVDILMAVPFMFVLILMLVIFEQSIMILFIGIGLISWLDMARIRAGTDPVDQEQGIRRGGGGHRGETHDHHPAPYSCRTLRVSSSSMRPC